MSVRVYLPPRTHRLSPSHTHLVRSFLRQLMFAWFFSVFLLLQTLLTDDQWSETPGKPKPFMEAEPFMDANAFVEVVSPSSRPLQGDFNVPAIPMLQVPRVREHIQ